MSKNYRLSNILGYLICPKCHRKLSMDSSSQLYCEMCKREYTCFNGIPDFRSGDLSNIAINDYSSDIQFQYNVDNFTKNTLSGFIRWVSKIISSDYIPFNQVNKFINAIPDNTIIIEIGSGTRRLHPNCVNIDIFPFQNVDILADAKKIPLEDSTVDYIVIDAVLEHVSEPQLVVDEIFRILKPKGKVICIAPFLIYYHGYPKHYFNFSQDGLTFLFRGFSEYQIQIYRGPFTAMISYFSEFIAIMFTRNNRSIFYALFRGISLTLIFWIKWFDRLWNPIGLGRRISQALCIIAIK